MAIIDKVIHQLTNDDLQHVNQFKLILIESFDETSIVSDIAGQGASLIAITYYLQGITIPSPVTLEYEESDSKFVKSLKRPDNVTLSFIETEKGIVWRFLQNWRKEIVQVAPVDNLFSTSFGQSYESVKYMFSDNQESAKKTGIVMPMGSGNLRIGKFPRIILHGMKYVSNSELQFTYTEGNNLIITAEFSVTEIGAPTLI